MGGQGRTWRRSARTAAVVLAAVVPLVLGLVGAGSGATQRDRTDPAARTTHPDRTTYPGKVGLGALAVPVHRPYRLNRSNPLAGRPMGVYQGGMEQAWRPFLRSRGAERRLLARIALRPKAKWYGAWVGDREIEAKVRDHVANATEGDPETLVQLTVFRMVPWEHEACRRLPTGAERASYRRWIEAFARGVGDAHAAIILQPDGPFALCAPGGSPVPSQLIRFAARRFAQLPHASVYIDGGAADWPKDNPRTAALMLRAAGVAFVRGFALNSTHYVPTWWDIRFGSQVVTHLRRMGVGRRHFVINTSSNGHGFEFGKARGVHPDHAKACSTRRERRCVTLGIPPTTAVADPAWNYSAINRRRAARNVDAYLWFGRPWLHMQADPFDRQRALALARTTPY